jgi:predicted MFS family arabinose efflux permease
LCRNQTNSPIEEKIDDISKYNPVSPATGEKREQEFDSQESVGYRSGFVVRNGALAYNLSGFFINLGANLIATEFGILLSEHFELSAGESGLFSLGLALGEFCGVLSTMSPWISSTSYSSLEGSNIFLLAFTLAFLLWGETKLEFTVLLLCLMFACVEFGTVLRFARAARFAHASDASAMLGSHVQFQFAGRTVGALLAASIYQTIGHHYLCAISLASFVLVSILLRLALYQKNKCGALT